MLQAVAGGGALGAAPPRLPPRVPHRLQRLLHPAQLQDSGSGMMIVFPEALILETFRT